MYIYQEWEYTFQIQYTFHTLLVDLSYFTRCGKFDRLFDGHSSQITRKAILKVVPVIFLKIFPLIWRNSSVNV